MALIKCPECGKQISSEVKTCPKCGYTIRKSNPVLAAIGWLFLIGLFLSIFSCEPKNKNLNTNHNSNNAHVVSEKRSVEVVEDKWCHGEFGSRTICGIIVNNTNRQYSYVQIEINLYDASGTQIGSTLDNVNNLEPGGKWRFNAYVIEDEAVKYKIKDVSAY
ncbi:MAG: zinc ribbon domain-containing protein [Alphaproteobacteria bacterium]|nr:zinc ribbon domain-containing protein [Alphaproteobacteria bacterium]